MSEDNPKTTRTPRPAMASTGEEAYLGRVLADRYVLKRQIGEGGFGIVFEAEDRRLGRRVAAKVLSAQVAKNPGALARFETEAKAAAQIGHEGIVDVRDFGSDGATHFIIMELIDGVDLAHVIKNDSPLPLTRCLSIAARVAQALAVAHDHGIIHRDLKPANILLTRIGGLSDFAKVLDFGISKIQETDDAIGTPVTETGTVVGTPRYMAPEQGIGTHRIDHRVDIYALGTILYEMATRDVPFSGSTAYETLHLKASLTPRAPSEVNPAQRLPKELDSLLARALDRDPERRFATMWELDVAIRKLLATVDPAAAALVEPTPAQSAPEAPVTDKRTEPTAATKPISVSPRRKSNAARTRRLVILLVGVAVAGAAVSVVAFLVPREEPRPPPAPASPAPTPPAVDASHPAEEIVELRLDIEPSQATVELDGAIRTDNPLRLPRGPEPHQLTISAAGFVTQSRSISATASDVISIHLEHARKTVPPPPRPPPPRNNHQRFPDTPIEPLSK